MNKRITILIILLIGITIVTGGFIVQSLVTSNNTTPTNILTQPETNIEPSSKTKEYIDASGFSFKYPDDVTVEKLEATDDTIYSQLKLSAQIEGSVVIIVQDTEFKTFEDWKVSNNTVSNVKEVTLGSLKGNEVHVGTLTRTIAIDQGILFSLDLDAKENKDYWDKVYEGIRTSFTFKAPENSVSTGTTTSADTGAGDDVIFEEEVIE